MMKNLIEEAIISQLNNNEAQEYINALKEYQIILERSIANIKKELEKETCDCMHTSCDKNTQQYCHLLQRNGILTNIDSDHHLMQPQIKSIFKWTSADEEQILPLEMQKIGTSKAFSGKLFCNYHDSSIFSPIEKKELNPYDYDTQILLTYRSICHEIRQKLDNIKNFELQVKKKKEIWQFFKSNRHTPKVYQLLDIHINWNLHLENVSIPSTIQSISELKKFKNELEQAINNGSKNFKFNCIETDLLPIAASSIISSEEYIKDSTKANNPYFLQIIPYKNKTYIITGYHTLYCDNWLTTFTQKWKSYSKQEIQLECSRLLLTRCLIWCMSPEFYNNLNSIQQNKLFKFHTAYFSNKGYLTTLEDWDKEKYNLFNQI